MKLKVGHWSVERKCQRGVVIHYGRRGSGVVQYINENFFLTECGHKDVKRTH